MPLSNIFGWSFTQNSNVQNDSIGLFSLPVELRQRIFEYALSDTKLVTLRIFRTHNRGWRSRHARTHYVPALMLINETIRQEAEDILYRTCPPVVSIAPTLGGETLDRPFIAWRLTCPSTLLPMLRRTKTLKLVTSKCAYWNQMHVLLVLRWLRAVLDNRTIMLEDLTIEFQGEDKVFLPKAGDALFEVFRGIWCGRVRILATMNPYYRNGAVVAETAGLTAKEAPKEAATLEKAAWYAMSRDKSEEPPPHSEATRAQMDKVFESVSLPGFDLW